MAQRYVQDVAPKGGFPEIAWTKRLPNKGFSGLTKIGIVAGITVYGYTHLYIIDRRNKRIEKARAEERKNLTLLRDAKKKFLGPVCHECGDYKTVGWSYLPPAVAPPPAAEAHASVAPMLSVETETRMRDLKLTSFRDDAPTMAEFKSQYGDFTREYIAEKQGPDLPNRVKRLLDSIHPGGSTPLFGAELMAPSGVGQAPSKEYFDFVDEYNKRHPKSRIFSPLQ